MTNPTVALCFCGVFLLKPQRGWKKTTKTLSFAWLRLTPKPSKPWSVLLCSTSNRSKVSLKSCTSKLVSPCPIPQNSLRLCSTAQKNQNHNFCAAAFFSAKARGFSFGLVISCKDDDIKQAMTVSLLMSYSPFSYHQRRSLNQTKRVFQVLVKSNTGNYWRARFSLFFVNSWYMRQSFEKKVFLFDE